MKCLAYLATPPECGITWDEYCVPSEKVLVDGRLATPIRAIMDGAIPKHPDLIYAVTHYGCFTMLNPATLTPQPWPAGAEIQISWSSRNVHTKAVQLWADEVVAVKGQIQLHHDVRPDLKPMTEVFRVHGPDGTSVTVLEQVTWVHNDGKIFFGEPVVGTSPILPKVRWLWVADGGPPLSPNGVPGVNILNSDDALDKFKTVFPTRDNLVPSAIHIATLNETYVPEDVWDSIIPKPQYGDDINHQLSDYGRNGIIVDIKPPQPDKGIFFAEIEFVHIDPWVEDLGPSPEPESYIIHETVFCDEVVLHNASEAGGDWFMHGEKWPEIKIVYKFWQGRYEHVVVGKDARSVDSIGAAMVSAAIKNKNLEIGMGALDMMDPDYKSNIPWVFRKFGEGYMKDDYYYGAVASDWAADDKRVALKDYWCTKWPVAGSNMIGVGGPLANLLSYYANDFTQALFGIPMFTPDPVWSGRIAGPTDWDMLNHHYSSFDSEDKGYAVVATQKDKNNTIMLVVWGHFGRDTYWASRWFEYEKFALQHINPHVTAVILEICYADPDHPSVYPIELLGTISQKPVHEDP
jgi:hypothetical protein